MTPPGTHRVYWDLPDPKDEPPDRVRAIRDDIRTRVERLIGEIDRGAIG